MEQNSYPPYKPAPRYLHCKTDSILSCGHGIDGRARPVQVDTEGAVSVLPNAATYAQAGWLFSINHTNLLPPDGQFLAFTFENPVANDKVMYLEQVSAGIFVNEVVGVRVNNEETIELVVAQTPQVQDVDETLTPVNNLLGSPNASTLLVRTVDDFNLGPILFRAIHPSGELTQDFRGRIILPPGYILLIYVISRVTNISNGQLTATVTWWERPVGKKNRKRKPMPQGEGEQEKVIKEKGN
ncbi:MAG TPA: hypothetical protein GXZ98_10480 [Firmicutes bacterium]|nr:hypothetical protein [Bacillota bacterium]